MAARLALAALVAVGAVGAAGLAQKPAPPMATEAEARTLCGTACHQYPPPEILPRAEWREEFAKMELFRRGSPEPPGPPGTLSRLVTLPDDMERVLRLYMSRAPVELPAPEAWPEIRATPRLQFARRPFGPQRASRTPSISNVQFLDVDRDGKLELVATEMSYGYVLVGRPAVAGPGSLEIVADITHPAHATLVDLDRDGRNDLLIANLGSYQPGDHQQGGVAWLRGMPDGRFAVFEMSGFPRVADVQAGDFDGDGRLDLLVGAFGWRTTGFTGLMRNLTKDYTQPSFETRRLDERSGVIHAAPADLDGDGRLDFVALVSQQHEAVVAFLNDGAGGFRSETIYAAPHPNWGFTGMQLVDFDGDGDLDVLVTNGDSFDDFLLKPYHGIDWLENRGSYPFVRHHLAPLAGVHRAVAVDLDGDGDLDVVAAAMIALLTPGGERALPSIVWLERTGANTFTRHTLERGLPFHATLDAADYDGDGDLDLVVGNFSPRTPVPAWVEVWENLRKTKQ